MNSLTGDLVRAATSFFNSTTGCSENILNVYKKDVGDPNLLNLPLTPKNVNLIVSKENEASLTGPGKTMADRIATIATPVRRVVAHGISSLMITGREGFHSDNPYSFEAKLGLTSGML